MQKAETWDKHTFLKDKFIMADKFKSSSTVISIEQAVGHVLAHDVTEIRPSECKGPAFKKGHIIKEKDLEHLRRLGKEHLYILGIGSGELHEDDAALRLAAALAGQGVIFDEHPSEGKTVLRSSSRGILKVDVHALTEFNMVPQITCSSRHNNILVDKDEIIAATRAIPLIIDKKHVDEGVRVASQVGGIFTVKKLAQPDTGIVITGNEVFSGRIQDQFAPIIKEKLRLFGCALKEAIVAPDDKSRIIEAIRGLLKKGCGLILVAGGMSVDPDDVSRMAIYEAGAEDLAYGTPVLPGAMFLYGRFGDTPILGLPACILYYQTTIFDLIIPRVLAGEKITKRDFAAMAHGGLCLNCNTCRYPVCPFGKGS